MIYYASIITWHYGTFFSWHYGTKFRILKTSSIHASIRKTASFGTHFQIFFVRTKKWSLYAADEMSQNGDQTQQISATISFVILNRSWRRVQSGTGAWSSLQIISFGGYSPLSSLSGHQNLFEGPAGARQFTWTISSPSSSLIIPSTTARYHAPSYGTTRKSPCRVWAPVSTYISWRTSLAGIDSSSCRS